MLSTDVISHRFVGDHILPRWLGPSDEAHVAEVLATIATFDGLTVGEVELLGEHRLEGRIEEALWAIERKRWETTIDAPVDPEAVRAIVFEHATEMTAADALAEASLALGFAPEILRGSLFADRMSRRRFCAPERAATPADLLARYNLAVVQSLLARAMTIEATLEGDPRAIVRAASRDGLLIRATDAEVEGRTQLDIAGPLTLFHETAKYGRSIARLVPALVAAPAWSLRARVAWSGRSAVFALSDDDAVLPGGALPALASTPLARKVARALRAVDVGVDFQPEVLRAEGAIVVPDFALHWGAGHRVYVDVLPFATAQHLASKLATLARLRLPMVLCVDDRWLGGIRAPCIVPYRRSIDAWPLLAAARQAAGLSEDAA